MSTKRNPVMPCRRRLYPTPAKNPEPRELPVTASLKMTLSVDELKNELGISRSTAYELIQKPDFPSFTIGRRVLISRDGLKKWIEKQCLTKDPEILQTIEK